MDPNVLGSTESDSLVTIQDSPVQFTPPVPTEDATGEDPLASVAPKEETTPAKQKGPHYALYTTLVNHLGWTTGDDKTYNYTPEQWKALTSISEKIAIALHASTAKKDVSLFVSNDFHHIVRAILRLKGVYGLAELGVMIFLDKIISSGLYKKLYLCSSHTAFFAECEEYIGYLPSKARDFQLRGMNFRAHWEDLVKGVGAETGMPLEELAARHLTKLRLYQDAIAQFDREETLRLFKSLTFREFAARIKAAKNPEPIARPAKSEKKATTTKDANNTGRTLDDIKDLTPVQIKCLRILTRGGTIHILASSSQDIIDRAIVRLAQNRQGYNEETRKEIGHKPYNPNNPLAINQALWSAYNPFEMIDRIRAGIALVAPQRRTVAILLYRLASEPQFRPIWKKPYPGKQFTAFSAFVADILGMGEEYRDYLRVGKNLARHHYILDGLDDTSTDAMFFSLRYLEDAVRTHNGDVSFIRNRLQTLSSREFALFARDPNFELNTIVCKLSRKVDERFTSIATSIDSLKEQYSAVDVIELFGNKERSLVQSYLDEATAEAASRSSQVQVEILDSEPDLVGSFSESSSAA